jgi:hypothetical protein
LVDKLIGYCFNAAEWNFPESPLRGAYAQQEVYAHMESWKDSEPWLSWIEQCSVDALQGIAREIPSEWYGERQELDCLLNSLFERHGVVRRLIDDFRKSPRNPFPSWTPGPAADTASDHIRALTATIPAAR